MNINNSLSDISSYQLVQGNAFSGLNRYAVGEFLMLMRLRTYINENNIFKFPS
jgi:hypothetical protein